MSALADGLGLGPDGRPRCRWCLATPDYVAYHDEEWGHPVVDEQRLFEKLCLEGFQSGLSWLTILRKREAFRSSFREFDLDLVSRFRDRDVERLLQDAAIIRHRGKIESVVNNARRALELRKEFGSLTPYLWGFEPEPASRPDRLTWSVLRAMPSTAESTVLSKTLKKRGWSFVGPTTVYAFMQAMGLVNDHLDGCFRREPVERLRRARALGPLRREARRIREGNLS